jgi:hypothetical protein
MCEGPADKCWHGCYVNNDKGIEDKGASSSELREHGTAGTERCVLCIVYYIQMLTECQERSQSEKSAG